MPTKQALIVTTNDNCIDASNMTDLIQFVVKDTCPEGTTARYLLKIPGGKWQTYNPQTKALKVAATQDLTAASVLMEGCTSEELSSATTESLAPYAGKIIDVAVGMKTENEDNILPTVNEFTVKGKQTFSNSHHAIAHPIVSLDTVDGLSCSNVAVDHGAVTIVTPAVGVALMQPGGTNGTWKHIDSEGNFV